MTRLGVITTTTVAALAVGASAVWRPAPMLIWNASASVPIGLYALRAVGALHLGDLVAARPPAPLAAFLAARRYLPRGVPLLKHIAALSGQRVCRFGRVIVIDGATVGAALDRDRRGRPLPAWRGCRRLGPGEVFLMNRRRADSLDGRYFGPLSRATLMGRADPLWIPTVPR